MAIRMARESHNDYLPELEAVAGDEMGLLFGSSPPQPTKLKIGEILRNTFGFLGAVRSVETFYVFARLDPYEQAELNDKARQSSVGPETSPNGLNRSRRVVP